VGRISRGATDSLTTLGKVPQPVKAFSGMS
jgi:hypothetical protein